MKRRQVDASDVASVMKQAITTPADQPDVKTMLQRISMLEDMSRFMREQLPPVPMAAQTNIWFRTMADGSWPEDSDATVLMLFPVDDKGFEAVVKQFGGSVHWSEGGQGRFVSFNRTLTKIEDHLPWLELKVACKGYADRKLKPIGVQTARFRAEIRYERLEPWTLGYPSNGTRWADE